MGRPPNTCFDCGKPFGHGFGIRCPWCGALQDEQEAEN